MLDTRFPRLAGDIGNPEGFGFPILYETVHGADPQKVVCEQSADLIQPFIKAGQALIARGADIVTTSCGFLALFQDELQEALPVPVLTSSLLLLPELEARHGAGMVGILTISSSSLDPSFRAAAGISTDVPVGTTEGGIEFSKAILGNREAFDPDLCRLDNVDAARRLVDANVGLEAILLECTNMAPYAEAISETVGLPVYSLNTLLSQHAECR